MSLTGRATSWEGAVADWLREAFGHAPAAMALLRGPEHVFEFANERFLEIFGDRPCLGVPVREAVPELAAQGYIDLLDSVYESGEPYRDPAAPVAGAGAGADRFFDFVYQPVSATAGAEAGIVVIGVEVSDLVHARDQAAGVARILGGEKEVLERIISGAALDEVLEFLVRTIEELSGNDVLGSILLLDEDGSHLRHAAAPGLPDEYNAAIDGIAIGPKVGSCGTAAFRREQVIVEDITVDPLWEDYRELAAAAGVRACWSTPIVAADDRLLGTFAMYYPDVRAPSSADLSLIDLLVRTAAVAIERHRADQVRDEALARERVARAEAERATEGLRFVLDVTTQVAGELDFEATLGQLAELAVPALADICAIDVRDGDVLRRAATAVHDPRHVGAPGALREHVPSVGSDHPIAAVFASGEPFHEANVTDELLRRFALDDEHLALLRDLGIESFVSVPLAARGEIFGVLTLASAGSGRRFDARDVQLAQDLARRAGLAIANIALYQTAHEAERRLSIVARAGVVLTSTLQVDEVISLLGDLLVPDVGDVCELHFVDDDGRLHSRTFTTRWQSTADPAPAAGPPVLVRRALESGVAVPIADLPRSRTHQALSRADAVSAGLRTGIIVPLVASGEPLGAVVVATTEDAPPAAIGADVMEVLAGRAALALHNARLFERQRQTAHVLQRSLLPPVTPEIPGVDLAASYQPALGGLIVGGDFYDFPRLGRRAWGFLLGDVCGKGAEAAALTGLVRYATRAAAMQTASPAKVLTLVNDVLIRDQANADEARFATMLFGRLRPSAGSLEVNFASAGHPLPYVLRRDGTISTVGKAGALLGILHEIEIANATVVLEPGDVFVAVTDGVLEARNDRDVELGDELARLLAPHAGASAATIASVVEDAALHWRPGDPRDDIAIVALRAA